MAGGQAPAGIETEALETENAGVQPDAAPETEGQAGVQETEGDAGVEQETDAAPELGQEIEPGSEQNAGKASEDVEIIFERGDTGFQEEEDTDAPEMEDLDMEDWDYQRPRRGQIRSGVILDIRDQEIIVDVGAKRDGVVPYADMQRLGQEAVDGLSSGDEVPVYIMRPEDQEGNLLVSLFLARQAQAWEIAQEMYEKGEAWEVEVSGYNKGGLVAPVHEIRGFIPASQVPGFPMGVAQEERLQRLSDRVGETMHVKIIEINRRKRRLILSATAARKEWRKVQRERLLEELREGEVRKGVVSSLANFGAFVDLGGADGLVHISELSWRRVRHPKEVVSVGDEVDVYVLRLDHERNRIGLSIKRLQPEPWALVEDKYELGQLVEGVVTNVVDFGAFAEIEAGIEGLIHVSELADVPVAHPRDVVKKSDLLLLRIIRIDVRRKRLGLSLKRVLESEWAEWAAQLAAEEEEEALEEPVAEEPAAEEEAPEEPVAEEPVAEAETPEEPAAEEEAPEEPVAEAETPEEPVAEEEAPEEPVAEEEAPEEPVAEEEAPEEPVAEEEAPEEPVAEQEAPEEPVAEEEAPEEPVAEEEAPEEPVAEEEAPEEPVAEEEAPEEPVAEEEAPEEPVAEEEAAEEPVAEEEAAEEPVAEEEAPEEPVAEEPAAEEEAPEEPAAEEPVAEEATEAPADEEEEAPEDEAVSEAPEPEGQEPPAAEDAQESESEQEDESPTYEPELAMVEA
jgi:small subunit ribosomal protein S1